MAEYAFPADNVTTLLGALTFQTAGRAVRSYANTGLANVLAAGGDYLRRVLAFSTSRGGSAMSVEAQPCSYSARYVTSILDDPLGQEVLRQRTATALGLGWVFPLTEIHFSTPDGEKIELCDWDIFDEMIVNGEVDDRSCYGVLISAGGSGGQGDVAGSARVIVPKAVHQMMAFGDPVLSVNTGATRWLVDKGKFNTLIQQLVFDGRVLEISRLMPARGATEGRSKGEKLTGMFSTMALLQGVAIGASVQRKGNEILYWIAQVDQKGLEWIQALYGRSEDGGGVFRVAVRSTQLKNGQADECHTVMISLGHAAQRLSRLSPQMAASVAGSALLAGTVSAESAGSVVELLINLQRQHSDPWIALHLAS